jgi:hypothetical protein
MTLMIDRVERVELLNMTGEVVYTVANIGEGTATLMIDSGPPQTPVVTAGVQKAIADYGETLRKLSNE